MAHFLKKYTIDMGLYFKSTHLGCAHWMMTTLFLLNLVIFSLILMPTIYDL